MPVIMTPMTSRHEDITLKVNRIYRQKNPSVYFRNSCEIEKFVKNRKEFLFNLKLPEKLFGNSSMIDFGCGTGQNSLIYDELGSNCTLIEYDKKSYHDCLKLFKKYAKNKFRVINKDIFKYKSKGKKYDFVISNGVAHHTKDPKKNINICCKILKKNGFFILGIGNKSGFFQRNLQRLILYKISNNEEDIIKYAKILFKEHLKRSVKYSGRKIDEVIFDTYLNPKIETFSLSEIKKIFSKNNLIFYSSYYPVKDVISFLEPNTIQFKLKKNKGNKTSNKNIKNITLSDFQDLTVSNNQTENIDLYNSIKKLYFPLDKLVKEIDNKSFERKKMNLTLKNIIDYKKRLLKIKKINIFNNKHNKIFLNEVIKIYKILASKKDKLKKFKNIKNYLKTTKKVFKGVSGVGMNYYVGYKIK